MKLSILALIIILLATALFGIAPPPGTAAAQGITLTASVQQSFPSSMTFAVTARSDARIDRLRLNYVMARQNYAKVVSEGWPQFTPATSVTAQWVMDMRRVGLPVGSKVDYWWSAVDAAGKKAETPRATTSFDDTRYTWQSITSDPVTLFWYQGDSAFANSLMAAARAGLARVANDTGAMAKRKVRVFIYASSAELQSAQLFAPIWEGGVTYQEWDLIAVGVATSQLDYGIRAVPHELSHWVVGQLTFNNYGASLPVWLDEGLATYAEGPILSDYQAALNFAISRNQLQSVRSLSSPFSAIPQLAYISYAESNSIVTYLIKTYGKAKMVQLLDVFRQGSGHDDALKKVYGFDQDGLDAPWRRSLGIGAAPSTQPSPAPATAWLISEAAWGLA